MYNIRNIISLYNIRKTKLKLEKTKIETIVNLIKNPQIKIIRDITK